MATTSTSYYVDRMTLADIPEVIEIERESFTLPWPANAYRRELQDNRTAHYVVVRKSGVTPRPPSPPPRDHRGGLFSFLSRQFEPAPSPARGDEPPAIYAYAGLWLMVDEAHITTIAVRASSRGRGLGELTLAGLIDISLEVGARLMTLEVRISNTVAQNLYLKYGFKQSGLRRRYYSDNSEDALIMTAEAINAPIFLNNYRLLKTSLQRKLG
ncbi:MAG TPA: ribosomal protein S18-alanine N-acetyltransferase [Chloroflexota bacterium]|nr:ribosomal protein S18-alanine N-acetyltransferase [Chloroflexota bacterium]